MSDPILKECTKCHEEKPLNEFNRTHGKPTASCRECINKPRRLKRQKEREAKLAAQPKLDPTLKICTQCGETKEIEGNYYIRNGKPISKCRTCTNANKAKNKRDARARKRQAKIDAGEIKVPDDPKNNKICSKCDEELPKSSFRKGRGECLVCEQKAGRKYRQSDIGKAKSKAWTTGNQDRMTYLQASWYQKNKSKINAKYRERYATDSEFRLKYNIKTRTNEALKQPETNKKIKHVDCTRTQLKEWLKFCFNENMTMENHGDYWHMDHVIPINTFDLTDEEQVKICFNWRNIMPLKGSDNMSKHDSIDVKQLNKHMNNLMDYEKIVQSNKTADQAAIHSQYMIKISRLRKENKKKKELSFDMEAFLIEELEESEESEESEDKKKGGSFDFNKYVENMDRMPIRRSNC